MENVEIERRFLADCPAFGLDGFERARIRQGYISFEPVIRLRQMDAAYFLTVKTPGVLTRGEYEIPVSKEEFAFLWAKTEPGVIDKTRYKIPLNGGYAAELDIYGGKLEGLITVEVEFPTARAAQGFTPPDWFGREVTEDCRYCNNNLARYGVP